MLNLAVLFDHPGLCLVLLLICIMAAGSFTMAWLTWPNGDCAFSRRRRPARRMPRVRYRAYRATRTMAAEISA
ncbi:hypothetical protein [Nitratidesulfovibrio sp. 1201_IL3209]|uniref:hypothetical protein n=1 Tax=Nitratidesulfovibrio sp. 1201_IL3209 TaxID=3084053 RepID=UPI002FDA7BF1